MYDLRYKQEGRFTRIAIPKNSNGLDLLFTQIYGEFVTLRVDKLIYSNGVDYDWQVLFESYYNIDNVIKHLQNHLIEN